MIDLITGHQGIPHISAEQISTLHRSLMGSNGDNKVVRMKDGGVNSVGLTVSIDTGYWRVHGYDMQIQEAEAVIFDPTEAGYQRIDDLFVEILQDISSGVQRSELVIMQGEPSTTTPIAPAAPTEAASEYDLLVECVPVCSVLVIEGAMTMTDLTIPFKASSGDSESLAPEFDPERPEPYEIGEIVENEGKLYIFIRQHSGPWDDADVEETTVAALLAEVNNELSAIENVYGAKNLIPYPCNQFSRTNNGITFTDNGDGTVTANGTATADASYNISQRYGVSGGSFSLKNGNYLLSGCESGSNTTFFLQTGVTKNGVFSLLNKNYDGDTAITVDGDDNSNDSANIAVQIVIRSGQTLTNKVFKPMIRLASIQDDTWVPYAKTNKELTDDVNEIEEDLENTMDLIRGDNDEYSSLKSYKVGQYVVVKPPLVPKETIYKCISPCSPGSWAINQSHFQSKTLTEAVTDLNNDLIALDNITFPTIDNNDYKFVWLRFNQTSDSAKAISLRGKVNGVAKDLTASDVYGAITFCCSENYNITHGWFINASNYWRSYTDQTNLSATYVVLALVRSNVNLTSEL